MNFQADNMYHIYNRGINKKKLFYKSDNYLFFLKKIKKYINPHCHLLAYCLMPNHFHIMIYISMDNEPGSINYGLMPSNALSEGFRLLLSSYTKAINKQENRTGNLFQQNTKCKILSSQPKFLGNISESINYADICFDYIHFNPVKCGLISNPGKWEYSSFNEYINADEYGYCDIKIATELLGLTVCHTYRCGTP